MEQQNDADLDLKTPEVLDKYRTAADITNRVLARIASECKPGRKIVELCSLGDKLILEGVEGVYTKAKLEKGIAFPTCISVNNIVGHFSPLSGDKAELKEGDVVKIDLGTHIDGFIAQVAHTLLATDKPTECTTGKKADVICAAHFAGECALRLFRPGKTNKEITEAINEVAKVFKCNVVEGVLSHQVKRFIIDGNNVVISKESFENKVEDVTFQTYDAFTFDIIMSTGEGKPKETEAKTTIFKRAPENQYKLKMPASRSVFSEIGQRFSVMPFTLRNFKEETRAKLGITECLAHDLVVPYPVLYEKEGEFVAQYKFTALLMLRETIKLTAHPLPFVKSEFEITDPKLKSILALGTKRSKKKKKGGKKAEGNVATPAPTTDAAAAPATGS